MSICLRSQITEKTARHSAIVYFLLTLLVINLIPCGNLEGDRSENFGIMSTFVTSTCVSKLRVVQFSGKNRRIAVVEYSRLVGCFLVLDQYFSQFLSHRPNFCKINNSSNLHQHLSKTISRSDLLRLSPECSSFKLKKNIKCGYRL